jgi:endonuclease/exonuclease/phosphatase family metal-dependent hydrolase
MKFLKYTVGVIFVIILMILVWYNWASKPNWSKDEYAKVIVNDHFAPSTKDSIYSIVTYNIGYLSGMTNNTSKLSRELYDENVSTVKTEIQRVNPHIIAFQEIDFDADRTFNINQQQQIADLGFNNIAQCVNWDERYVPYPYLPISGHFGKVISGQSVLSNYDITFHERVVLSRVEDEVFFRRTMYLDRLAQVVKINIYGVELIIINIHVEAFDKPTRLIQTKEVAAIFTKYAEDYPVILLGDFNSDPKNEEATINEILKLENIAAANLPSENYELTFTSEKPYERLDHIFYTPQSINCVSSSVFTQFGTSSDHLQLEMKLTFK